VEVISLKMLSEDLDNALIKLGFLILRSKSSIFLMHLVMEENIAMVGILIQMEILMDFNLSH
jgi:hypothetical protein